MSTLLSPAPTRRSHQTEPAPSVASLKQRWRRATIASRLPIRRRFELLAMLEFAGGFGARLSIGDAPTWTVQDGILRDRAGAYEFDAAWLRYQEADAEQRWLEQHRGSGIDPDTATRMPAAEVPVMA